MWYPLGKPESLGVFHVLKGEYGQNKICKQRNHAGDQGVCERERDVYVREREREMCVGVCAQQSGAQEVCNVKMTLLTMFMFSGAILISLPEHRTGKLTHKIHVWVYICRCVRERGRDVCWCVRVPSRAVLRR